MKKGTMLAFALMIGFSLSYGKVYAQWVTDSKYKFKINLPSGWTKKSHMDGSDKVYDFYSADNNAAVQLRVFEADSRVNTAMLAQVYEQKMLPQGTQKKGLTNHTTTNGIPGMMGLYSLKYNNVEVNMASFYTVQHSKGYVLTAIIPASMLNQKSAEVKSVTQSFVIDGFSKQIATNQTTTTPNTGLSSLITKANTTTVSTTNGSYSPAQLVGRYNFISRSDGKVLTNYHYILLNSDGSYAEKYEPKSSPGYNGGVEGTWSLQGDKVICKHKYSNLSDVYTVVNKNQIRQDRGGTVYIFRK